MITTKIYTFYKILDPYDMDIMATWDFTKELPLANSKRVDRSIKYTDKEKEKFIAMMNDINTKVKQALGTPNDLDPENTIVKTDISTYNFDNMMQLLYRLYSGYTHYEDPETYGNVLSYGIITKDGTLIGKVFTTVD